MSRELAFYFQVHQPWRVRAYHRDDIGRRHDYFDEAGNAAIMQRVAERCYLPMNALLQALLAAYPDRMRLSFSISGSALEQMALYAPAALASFRALFATGAVELLAETSHHSLAALYSEREFGWQLARHRALCEDLLGITPGRVLRNTELISSDAIARLAQRLGYRGLCVEGADGVLNGRKANGAYRYAACPELVALARDCRLSDDIAFRYADRTWTHWPLQAETFAGWLPSGCTRLYMDYETFGEHQPADSGIFTFMRTLMAVLVEAPETRLITLSQACANTPVDADTLSLPEPVSWAGEARDLSAWAGNAIQQHALAGVFALEPAVWASGDASLQESWRRLLACDHFHHMATKQGADDHVHRHFSPFDSPYAAYLTYMNVLADLTARLAVDPA